MSQSIYYSLKNVPSKFKKLRSSIKTDKINYFSFYPEVIHMLDTNLEKINWHNLLRNPEAIHQLQTNLKN